MNRLIFPLVLLPAAAGWCEPATNVPDAKTRFKTNGTPTKSLDVIVTGEGPTTCHITDASAATRMETPIMLPVAEKIRRSLRRMTGLDNPFPVEATCRGRNQAEQ
jgi:hypothetical protein